MVLNTTLNRVLDMVVIDRTGVGACLLYFGKVTSGTVAQGNLLVLGRLHCTCNIVHLLIRYWQSSFQGSMTTVFKELFGLADTEVDIVEPLIVLVGAILGSCGGRGTLEVNFVLRRPWKSDT